MSYEQVTVVGNIGSVEVAEALSGAKYLKLSVAANRGSGEKKKTVWYSVLLFGEMVKNMETLLKYFTVGRLIIATGRPQVKPYTKNDGTPSYEFQVIAASMPQLLDHKKSETS